MFCTLSVVTISSNAVNVLSTTKDVEVNIDDHATNSSAVAVLGSAVIREFNAIRYFKDVGFSSSMTVELDVSSMVSVEQLIDVMRRQPDTSNSVSAVNDVGMDATLVSFKMSLVRVEVLFSPCQVGGMFSINVHLDMSRCCKAVNELPSGSAVNSL